MPMRPVEIGGTKTRDKGRNGWIDLARAVAMVLVVFGHAERGLAASSLMRDVETASLDLVIYSFHIPLFFLISGLLFAQSIKRNPFLVSWRTRIMRLVHPCVVWSIILVIFIVLASGVANRPISPMDAVFGLMLLPVDPVSIFWFIYTLLLCMVLSGLAVEYLRWSGARLLFWSLCLHIFYLLYLTDRQVEIGLQFVRFAEHQLYFALGFFLSDRVLAVDAGFRGRKPDLKLMAASGVFAAVCFAAAAMTLVEFGFSYHSVPGTLAAVSGSATVLFACYLFVRISGWPVSGIVLLISSETLAIFCMHVPFVSGGRIVLHYLGLENPVLFLALLTGAGIIGPLLALRLIDGLGLSGFFGFGARRAQTYAGQS